MSEITPLADPHAFSPASEITPPLDKLSPDAMASIICRPVTRHEVRRSRTV